MSELEKEGRPKSEPGLAVSPSLDLVMEAEDVPRQPVEVDRRTAWVAFLAVLLGAIAAVSAVVLIWLINFITNLAFYGEISIEEVSPAGNHLGLFVVAIPVIGAIIVGLMARFGSPAIRGHGIPEAMDQVLTNRSRIPARVTFLKPISAAISIGTGGPFGAEGPIIATGGALGSVIGQLTSTTAAERRTLLASGAAAGMAATFGCPLAAVLLAVELLLFEFRARSLIPVAFASATATGLRFLLVGTGPVFPMPAIEAAGPSALAVYALMGAVAGVAAVIVTKIIYLIEDGFEKLPVHWMWWPAIGAIAVGVIGYFAPHTLGVGYENITDILSGNLGARAIFFLCTMKFISWAIALGSGTSGGTLAPIMTVGSGFGALFGMAVSGLLPGLGVDPRVAALVAMAAYFTGASRAILASVVFAFETTQQPMGLLPLLAGCTAAYFVSHLLMRNTIMTERIARRGVRPPSQYRADTLDQILVNKIMSKTVVSLKTTDKLEEVRQWISTKQDDPHHNGFPVLDERDRLFGVVTRRDLFRAENNGSSTVEDVIRRSPKFVYQDCSVRQAADHMVRHRVGRLPVVNRANNDVIGILTRADVLSCFRHSLEEDQREPASLAFRRRNEPDTHDRTIVP